MKFFRLAVLGAVLLFANSVFAQSVVVTGSGADKESALKDAMRGAVESVVGTFIDSRTLVDKSAVALDEIYSKSQGFVTDVKVLEESGGSGSYKIKAQIEVNTDPDSQLQNRLAMIMALNDPRIGVAVDYYDGNGEAPKKSYPAICTAAMNAKLLALGFHHVVDCRAPDNGSAEDKPKQTLDYRVTGRMEVRTEEVVLPGYKDLGTDNNNSVRTGLWKTYAGLSLKITKEDTQELIGEFTAETNSIKNSAATAEQQAVKELGVQAAEKLRQALSRKAADNTKMLRVIVRTEDSKKILALEKALKNTAGVNNAFLRSFEKGKGILEIEGILKPIQLYSMIRNDFDVFMETASENTLEISLN